MILRGKRIGPGEVDVISGLVKEFYPRGRCFISRKVCEAFGWLQPNGKAQDVACREILRRLETAGLVSLPRPLRPANNQAKRRGPDNAGPDLFALEGPVPMEGSLKELGPAVLRRVETLVQNRQWRDMVGRYHYLGYAPMVGRAIKYFIYLKDTLAGAIAWGSPCWKLSSRDDCIGWDAPTRQANLQRVAGNHRFLILPWVRVKNLASHVLSLAARQMPQDWKSLYGIDLVLLESFVDPSRFKGTCYKAANWIKLGQSKGSSKSGNAYHWHGQVKDVYVLPLRPDFREQLCRQ